MPVRLHSYPELLKRKSLLIDERKYFFKKYFCREEKELMEMFSEEDKVKWIENKNALHDTTVLIEGYRKQCRDKGQPYI